MCSGLEAQRGTQRAACREPQRLCETFVPVSIIIAWLALLPPPALPCRLLRRGVGQGRSCQALVCLLFQPAALLAHPKERQRLVHVQGTLLGLSACPAARGFDVMCTIFTQRASFHLPA